MLVKQLAALTFVILVAGLSLAADEARPVLSVIRLKPGQSKSIEVAISRAEFRPANKSGRDFLEINTIAHDMEYKKTKVPPETDNNRFTGRYLVTPELIVVWSKDKPELEFHAGKDAKKGGTDIQFYYRSFGGGTHAGGFRVVVE